MIKKIPIICKKKTTQQDSEKQQEQTIYKRGYSNGL